MSTQWIIAKPFEQSSIANYLGSLENTMALSGVCVSEGPKSRVIKIHHAGHDYYVKQYTSAGNLTRKWCWFNSRVRSEWNNLHFFQTLGIATPPLVAFGEMHHRGWFRFGTIVTQGIEKSTSLLELTITHPHYFANKGWRQAVMRQVAEYTRRLHETGFVHIDLKWRNILVQLNESPKVFFIDCPGGHMPSRFSLPRFIIKDLACLDKVAKYQLSKTERCRFFLNYMQHSRLTQEDKATIHKITHYFAGRE